MKHIETGLEVISCTVQELFLAANTPIKKSTIKGKINIPEYQRPYVWTSKQILQLIVDLSEFSKNENSDLPLYYLGSFIIHSDGNKLNIIDGQQRITSLLILMYLKNEQNFPDIMYNSPLSVQQIKSNINYLKQKQNDQEVVLPKIDFNKINVTLVVTKSEDLAYTFFETQNTGGKRLSGADIIKSHHLRAVGSSDLIGLYAKKWEGRKMTSINYVINLLSKARYWDVLNWKEFPFYRNKIQIKNTIVNEFTNKTIKSKADIQFSQVEITKVNYNNQIKYISKYKAIRQPLFDGINYIDYLLDYVELYEILFKENSDYRVDTRFYEFRNKLITGNEGTIFLKEIFEVVLISYVSKFGFLDIYKFSLWAFRYVYSIRVIKERTVREDVVNKFVRDHFSIDRILTAFTSDEVILYLKRYTYSFNDVNVEDNNVKGRYIKMLGHYFNPYFSTTKIIKENFDTNLKKAINEKL